MNRNLVLTALVLALTPHALVAQQDPAARIEAARRQAAAAGIPVQLLESRVAEGRAKGVPMERIAAVVERRAAALQRAQEAMSRATRDLTQADLAAGADAVEAGIDASALRAVIEGARAEDRPVAIAVLTYLHRERGLPVDQALAQVAEASKKGPEALRQLPAHAAAAKARRGPPEGVGNRPPGAGKGGTGGPPAGLPSPGQKPGAGKPDGVGKPDGAGKPQGKGGGRPGG